MDLPKREVFFETTTITAAAATTSKTTTTATTMMERCCDNGFGREVQIRERKKFEYNLKLEHIVLQNCCHFINLKIYLHCSAS